MNWLLTALFALVERQHYSRIYWHASVFCVRNWCQYRYCVQLELQHWYWLPFINQLFI